jgi:predicted AlkP superfamily phosphohydrolase/phosphomutase
MRRVLAIGLDAAEPGLIERWTDDGTLPTLRRLRSAGRYGRLSSSAAHLSGSPWPTFFTGRTPAQHGRYSYLGWRPETMRVARPTAEYLPVTPFWHTLGEQGRRVVAIDIPLTYSPTAFDGIQICNWATHEALDGPATFPAELLGSLRREFGKPGRVEEDFGLLPLERLLAIGAHQCELVDRLGTLAQGLMRRERWDLFLVAFAGTHRGGHKLWDATAVEGAAPGQAARLEEALRQIYVRTDRAVGELVDTAGADVSILVFSLHGMGENTSRSELLPEMLRRVLAGSDTAPQRRGSGLTARLRRRIPVAWRNGVKARLPLALQDRLTAYWSMGRRRWAETRAFCLVSDLQGYVRINLRGREARGIVEPGTEYDRLLEEIRTGIGSFVDVESGEPVAQRVTRTDQLYPPGERRHLLPDLIVRWSRTPAAPQRRIVSPRFGTIDRELPRKNPNGRAGNHRPEGFLIVAGAGVHPGPLPSADILDLAPTIFTHLGLAPPAELSGRPIDLRGTG